MNDAYSKVARIWAAKFAKAADDRLLIESYRDRIIDGSICDVPISTHVADAICYAGLTSPLRPS